MGINGEPNDSSSSAIPADAVNGLDEITQRQCPLLVIGFHAMTISRKPCRRYGVLTPAGISMDPSGQGPFELQVRNIRTAGKRGAAKCGVTQGPSRMQSKQEGKFVTTAMSVIPSHLRAVCRCKTPPAQLYSPRAKGGLRLDQGRRDEHLGSTGRLHPARRRAARRRAVESWLQRQGVIVLSEPKYVTQFP